MAAFDPREYFGGGSLGEAQGAPVISARHGNSGLHRSPEFPGPGGLVRGGTTTAMSPPQAATVEDAPAPARKGRGGRPKLYPRVFKTPLADAEYDTLAALAARWKCSMAEANRRLIAGTKVPAPVERIAVSDEQYAALLDALASNRTPVNRTAGDIYRLVRDFYVRKRRPVPDELVAMRDMIDAGMTDLRRIAEVIAEIAP